MKVIFFCTLILYKKKTTSLLILLEYTKLVHETKDTLKRPQHCKWITLNLIYHFYIMYLDSMYKKVLYL